MILKMLNSKGTSLLELTVAMLIGSLVISAAYKSHDYLSKSAARESKKAEIQRDIVTIIEKFEHDIRMAGIGLPGNGIEAELSDTASDKLFIYMNSGKTGASLTTAATYCNTKLIVTNAEGATVNGYVCLAANGVDTIYRAITGIGINPSGVDTIYLNSQIASGPYPIASSTVNYCTRIAFKIEKIENKKRLVTVRNQVSVPLGTNIDTLALIPKRYSGTVVGTDLTSAGVMSVFTGGYVGTGSNRRLISESTEVNIRNRD